MFFFKPKKKEVTLIKSEFSKKKENFNNIENLLLYIEQESGINLFLKQNILKPKIIKFSKDNNIYSFENLIKIVKKKEDLYLSFMDLLSINETYFFREIKQIEESIKYLKTKNPPFNILSAPSSSGEEVYTIIIMLMESGFKSSDINILGIDISKNIIQIAQDSIYKKRSVHRVSTEILNKYFQNSENESYIPNLELKKIPKFKQFNIFDKNITNIGKFDIIFSRNMFIYFDDETKIKAYNILKELKRDKYSKIYLGHADISSNLHRHMI